MHLLHVVTQEWPQILGLDAVAVALFAGDTGFARRRLGVQFVDAAADRESVGGFDGVVHARLSSAAIPCSARPASLIRAEALIRLDREPPLPSGLLALGQRDEQSFDTRHGSELLMFLGRVLTRYDGPVADRSARRPNLAIRRARWPRAGHGHPRPRPPPLAAYGARLCRHRAPFDRLPRPPSRRGRSAASALLTSRLGPARLSRRPARAAGSAQASAARELSAVRAFLRFAAGRAGEARNCRGLKRPSGRAPCRARSRPTTRWRLAEEAAEAAHERLDRRARHGDAAAALRVRPAGRRGAGLTARSAADRASAARHRQARQDARGAGASLPCREAIDAYVAAVPLSAGRGVAVVPRRPGRAAQWRARAPRGARGAPAAGPARQPDAACAAPQLRHPFAGRRRGSARRCRSCSATPACPRPRSTPRSMRRSCSTSTATRIRAPDQAVDSAGGW